MQFLFMRRFIEMVILTIIPSLIASALIQLDRVQGAIFYPVLAIISVVCTVIFFGGNLLMMRRMVRDIKSKKIYMVVQYTTFIIYTILITLICTFTWDKSGSMFLKDARVAFFFHSRVFEVICDPIIIDPDDIQKNLISPNMSMIISTAIFGLVTVFSYPFFKKRYIKEQEMAEKLKRESEKFGEREMDKYAVSVKAGIEKELDEIDEHEDHEDHEDGGEDRLYSVKELRKMEKMSRMSAPIRKKRINWMAAKRISANRGNDIKLRDILKEEILNFGSYSFYQNVIEKQQNGEFIGGYVTNYYKSKINLFKKTKPTK